MEHVRLTIDGREIEAQAGSTLLEAARAGERYIPSLCHHPNLPSAFGGHPNAATVYRGPKHQAIGQNTAAYEGCGLCFVEIEGQAEPVRACATLATEGMAVRTDTEAMSQGRQQNLKRILADHPHACILCPLREGCDRRTCSMNVPLEERCCDIFNHCEIRFVSEHIGIPPDTPQYVYKARPVVKDEPLFTFDWNLCINCTRCVRVCRDVRGIEALGLITDDNGRVTVGTKGPTLDESGCIFCGACLAVCPSGAIMDKEKKKAQDAFQSVPCVDACPAGIDIPRYVRFIAEGKYPQALAVIREKVPLPGVLGYVCYHPCERACRRGELNQPVSICRLKRFAFEHDDGSWKRLSQIKPDTGKRVAVVGSGPAGLTATYYLRKQGHAVTVFEALPQTGGMLRYGIPEFRLPREVLEREIREIEAIGVQIATNTKVGSLNALFEKGFDAIFLASGAHRERRLGISGEALALSGLEFLRRVNSGCCNPSPIRGEVPEAGRGLSGRRVAVIGGGNVATDVARTALRLRAKEATIFYRRRREQMPAYIEEIEQALEEGVQLQELTIPLRLEDAGTGLKLILARARLEQVEGETKSRPVVVPNSEFVMEFDTVIAAIGQEPEVAQGFQLTLADGFTIQIDRGTLQTNRVGVFAGGDAVGGPASVIEAIAWGRRAAQSIDRYLGGDGKIEERLVDEELAVKSSMMRNFREQSRAEASCLAPEQRLLGLDRVVEQGYDDERARYEAQRCLRCDLRMKLARVPLPPRPREPFKPLNAETIETLPEAAGVYRLYDEKHEVLAIKGVPNLKSALQAELGRVNGKFFSYEAEPMYTQRESELLQQYLQRYGRWPTGGDGELEGLF